MIIDAHHHLWAYRPGLMSWLDAGSEQLDLLRRDYDGGELAPLLRENGVDGTVVIQAANTIEDTRSMIEAARRHAFIKGIVAWAPLEDPDATVRQLDEWTREPRIVGIRHLVLFEPDPDWLVRPNVLRCLECVAERGLTYDLTNGTEHHLRHVLTLAERLPELRIIIDHLGKPNAVDGVWEPWAGIIAAAARYPNVNVKLSGFANVATRPVSLATKEHFRRYVEHVLEHFGAHRIIMASNWPPSNLAADYTTTWQQTRDLVSGLPPEDRAAIQGANAVRVYKLV